MGPPTQMLFTNVMLFSLLVLLLILLGVGCWSVISSEVRHTSIARTRQ
jgi:hypothetical protein